MTSARTRTYEKLAIFGAGGHAREVAFIAERTGLGADALVFVVEQAYRTERVLNGLAVHTLESGHCDGWPFLAAVGNPALKERAVALCESRGMHAVSLSDPGVTLHKSVELGNGTIIFPGAVLTVNISLGAHVHVNAGASVSHDCKIGAYSIVSPGAHIAGHVQLGSRVFIGIGACIVNGRADMPLTIGDGALIAAGACVTQDVPPGARVMGVPARTR